MNIAFNLKDDFMYNRQNISFHKHKICNKITYFKLYYMYKAYE